MIPIYFGTNERRKSLATYEDYCPIHRGLHEFDLEESRSGLHLYGVSLGRGKHQGHVGVSKDVCATEWSVQPSDLSARTAQERWAARLATERQLQINPSAVRGEERAELFFETVTALVGAHESAEKIGVRAAARTFFYGMLALIVLLTISSDATGVMAIVTGIAVAALVATITIGPFVAKAIVDTRHRRPLLDLVPGALLPLELPQEVMQSEFKRMGRSTKPIKKALKRSNVQSHEGLTTSLVIVS